MYYLLILANSVLLENIPWRLQCQWPAILSFNGVFWSYNTTSNLSSCVTFKNADCIVRSLDLQLNAEESQVS